MADAQLTPEQQQALLDYAHQLPARSDIVKQQLARAKALRDQHTNVPAYGFWGPALGGVGDAIANFAGARKENQLWQEQLKNANAAEELLKQASPFQQPAAGMPPGDLDEFGKPLSAPPLVQAPDKEEQQKGGFVPFGF